MNDRPDLNTASANLTQTVTRRLILWAVRWVVGFGIIVLAAYLWPASSWLWWSGGAIAVLSLAATLVTHFVLQRKIAAVQRKMDDLERLWAEIDDEASDNGNQT